VRLTGTKTPEITPEMLNYATSSFLLIVMNNYCGNCGAANRALMDNMIQYLYDAFIKPQ